MHGFASARYKSFRSKSEALGFIESNQDKKSSAPVIATKKKNERCENVKVHPTLPPGDDERPIKRQKVEVHRATVVPLQNPYTQSSKITLPARQQPLLPATLPAHRESSVVVASPPTKSTVTNRKLKVHINFDGGSRGNPGLAGGTHACVRHCRVPAKRGDLLQLQRLTRVFFPCRRRPGTSAGAVITLQEQCAASQDGSPPFRQTIRVRDCLPHPATNNVAEYRGVIVGLTVAWKEVNAYVTRQNVMSSMSTPSLLRTHLVIQGDSQLIVKQITGKCRCNNAKLKPYLAKVKTLLSEFQGLGDCQVSVEHVYREFNSHADGTSN